MINNRDQTVMQFQIIPMSRNTSLPDFLYQSHFKNPVLGFISHQLAFPVQIKPVSTVALQTQNSSHLGIFIESFLTSPAHAMTGIQLVLSKCLLCEGMNKQTHRSQPSHSSRSCPSLRFSMATFYKPWTAALTPWPDSHCTQLRSLPLNSSLAWSSCCLEHTNLLFLTQSQFSLRLRLTVVVQPLHSLQHPVQD